jgi:hypothetical protein
MELPSAQHMRARAVMQLLYGIVLQHWYVRVVNHKEDYSKDNTSVKENKKVKM